MQRILLMSLLKDRTTQLKLLASLSPAKPMQARMTLYVPQATAVHGYSNRVEGTPG